MSEWSTDLIPILDCFVSIGTCLLLSVTYVASLYIWKSKHHRDHPITIKQRFISVLLMAFITPMFLYVGLNKKILQRASFLEIMGFKTKGLCQAIIVPVFLTAVPFLGSLYMQALSGHLKTQIDSMYWIRNLSNLIWLRNHVVGPLSEEFTFRSCMLPLLLQCFSPLLSVFICPLFFGVAHFHHMIERIRYGVDFKTSFTISCFHFTYTTIFGAYASYIFLRTGHFMSSFVVHAFCNHMGFPDVQELSSYGGKQQVAIISLYIVGFILWCYLLNPLTEPKWYYNDNFFYAKL